MITEKQQKIVDAVNYFEANAIFNRKVCPNGDVPMVIADTGDDKMVVGSSGYNKGAYYAVCNEEEFNQ